MKLTGGRQGRHGPGAAPRRKFEAGASDDGPASFYSKRRRARVEFARDVPRLARSRWTCAPRSAHSSDAAAETTAAPPPTAYMPARRRRSDRREMTPFSTTTVVEQPRMRALRRLGQ